jgi:hypothetical protein
VTYRCAFYFMDEGIFRPLQAVAENSATAQLVEDKLHPAMRFARPGNGDRNRQACVVDDQSPPGEPPSGVAHAAAAGNPFGGPAHHAGSWSRSGHAGQVVAPAGGRPGGGGKRLCRAQAILFSPAGARALAISRTAMTDFLKRLRLDVTVHGFRSSFRDWAAETTASPIHVIEMALAHQIGDAVERSYRRGDLFDKRARFMSEWAHYCTAKRLTRQATSRRSVRGGYDGQASQQTRPDDDALRQEIS